jgi:hypothetical protein
VRLAALCLLFATSTAAFAAPHDDAQLDARADSRLLGSYKFVDGGWTYVHLEGTPEQVGFQHGYRLAAEIEDNVQVYKVEALHDYQRPRSSGASPTVCTRRDRRSIFGTLLHSTASSSCAATICRS